MTAEEIFSSWIFYLFIALIAIFLIPLFIDFKKGINKMSGFLAEKTSEAIWHKTK